MHTASENPLAIFVMIFYSIPVLSQTHACTHTCATCPLMPSAENLLPGSSRWCCAGTKVESVGVHTCVHARLRVHGRVQEMQTQHLLV